MPSGPVSYARSCQADLVASEPPDRPGRTDASIVLIYGRTHQVTRPTIIWDPHPVLLGKKVFTYIYKLKFGKVENLCSMNDKKLIPHYYKLNFLESEYITKLRQLPTPDY